jgi:AcrR family transcriptional regulator
MDAGFELFGTVGFPDTSISGLCAAASVTERHFYEEFASREALLEAVYDGVADRAYEEVRLGLQAAGLTQIARIRLGNLRFFQFLTEDVRRARIYAFEAVGTSPELERHRRARRQRFIDSLTRGLERLAASGVDVGLDLHVASAALAGASHELVLEWLLSPERIAVETLADTIATLWIRTLQLDPDFALSP